MSSCKCGEMSRCKHDIKVLETVINVAEKICDRNENQKVSALANQTTNHVGCITPDNLQMLADAITQHNDDLRSYTKQLLEDCEEQKRELDQKFLRLEEEDIKYHEEEDDDDEYWD